MAESADHRFEVFSRLGHFVAHPHRGTGDYVATNKSFALKSREPFGQQTIREPGHYRQQLIETLRAGEHRIKDGAAPSPSDKFDGMMKSRTKPGRLLRFLAFYR